MADEIKNDTVDDSSNAKEEISSFDLFWYKHKNHIKLGGICLAITLVFILGLLFIFRSKESVIDEGVFKSDDIRLADYLISGTSDKEITLSKASKKDGAYTYKEIDEIVLEDSGDYLYSTDSELYSLYTYDKNSKSVNNYYIENEKITTKKIATGISEEDAKTFKFDEDILVLASDKKLSVQYDGKVETIISEEPIVNYLISDKHVIYASGNLVNSYDVVTKETASADLSKPVQDIELIDNQVIALSSYGSGIKKSTIATFKINDLYVTGLTDLAYTDSKFLQNASTNYNFYIFSTTSSKNAITNATIDNEIAKVEKLKGTFDEVGDNDVGRNGYAYLIKKNKVSAITVDSGDEYAKYEAKKIEIVVPVIQ